jgi:hypothetical protein
VNDCADGATVGRMQALRARVRNGRLVLDEPTNLPEGAEVELLSPDDLDDEERAELDRSLDEAIDEVRAGNTVDGPEFLAKLRASR